MFHSDRGTQYMSYTFVHLLEDFGVKQSFSRTARPHDNAVRRIVFLNPQKRRTISAALYRTEKLKIGLTMRFFIGPPGGIRTPGLQNRNLLRYPASPRADKYK